MSLIMYDYLSVVTLKGGVDRRCSDSSDVLMITVQWCSSLFNATVIALLVVIGSELPVGHFHLTLVNFAVEQWLSSADR